MNRSAAHVRIQPGAEPGRSTILVDGTDIAPVVKAAHLRMTAGHLPVLSVELDPAEAETDLYAYVIGQQFDVNMDALALAERIRTDLVDELRQIDPQDLEEGALQRLGSLAGGQLTQGGAFLAEILERLQ